MNETFYPTPKTLIEKMLHRVGLSMHTSILEPSAGKGDICDYVRDKLRYGSGSNANIDTIEIDANLQHILRGKNYRVVHDNFLTFKSSKHYDLILANFPFNEGDKHVKQALNILEASGGALIALVNAETLKNPYTNLRKALLNKLEHYGATIEYLEEEFVEAERKTNVEVALIKVQVPKPDVESVLLDSLKRAEEIELEEQTQSQIVETDFIKALIKRFNNEVRVGLKIIDEYNSLAPLMLQNMPKKGEDNIYNKPILSLTIRDNNYQYGGNIVNDYLNALRVKYWRVLIGDSRFTSKYTTNVNRTLSEKLSQLKDYDFTEFNIKQLETELNTKLISGIETAILDLFDRLSNRYSYHNEFGNNIHYYNGWKSNKAHKINEKVIIPMNGFGSYSWGKDKLDTYDILERIQDMVKVFNYLTGDLEDVHNLVSLSIEKANNIGKFSKLDFYYFEATFYKKGTCHITFKDKKLLDKFNIFGSQKKGWLPPSYGYKKYSEMSKEEQEVVRDFQPINEYEDVISNKDYYIVNSSTLLLEKK